MPHLASPRVVQAPPKGHPLSERPLYEVRFHGRGGQGTVVASILLAEAAFQEGRGVQAFPFFGVERRGAPVVAYTRIGLEPVRIACAVEHPDVVVVGDPSLLTGLGDRLLGGLEPGSRVIVNTPLAPSELGLNAGGLQVATVDATAVARKHKLGSAANPIVNTAILGAVSRITGIVTMESVEAAIRKKVPARPDDNVAAAWDAYNAEVKQ